MNLKRVYDAWLWTSATASHTALVRDGPFATETYNVLPCVESIRLTQYYRFLSQSLQYHIFLYEFWESSKSLCLLQCNVASLCNLVQEWVIN